jgi:hypothetical protein
LFSPVVVPAGAVKPPVCVAALLAFPESGVALATCDGDASSAVGDCDAEADEAVADDDTSGDGEAVGRVAVAVGVSIGVGVGEKEPCGGCGPWPMTPAIAWYPSRSPCADTTAAAGDALSTTVATAAATGRIGETRTG